MLCSFTATVSRFVAYPTVYKGVVVIQQPDCSLMPDFGFNCSYDIVLGDNKLVPHRPNLDSEDDDNDIEKFLVWQSKTIHPYTIFDLGRAQEITALRVEFLNYPAQGFSLPNLQLLTATVPNPNSPPATPVSFVMLNNSFLSQEDNEVTHIILRLNQTTHSQYFILYWNYTDIYNLDYFMVSEVDLCLDTQPPYSTTEIEFLNPLVDNKIITYNIEDVMTTGAVVLNCTVSTPGSFEWQWTQNGSPEVNFLTFTADGTRTSIAELTFYDSGLYTCEVKHRNLTSYISRTWQLSFPGIYSTIMYVY